MSSPPLRTSQRKSGGNGGREEGAWADFPWPLSIELRHWARALPAGVPDSNVWAIARASERVTPLRSINDIAAARLARLASRKAGKHPRKRARQAGNVT